MAQNVREFVSVTIEFDDDSSSRKEMDLKLHTIGGGIRDFSVPPGRIMKFTLRVIADQDGLVGCKMMDEDTSEALRGWDDEIGERFSYAYAHAGDTVTIYMWGACSNLADEFDDLEGSGEQSSEIYLQSGSVRVPEGPNAPLGDRSGWFWKIDCDKAEEHSMNTGGGSINAFWGDELIVPPGALAGATTVKMANMAPLVDENSRPPTYAAISEAVVLQPDALSLAVPATLVFHYQPGEVGDVSDESTLRVFRYDAAAHAWFPVAGSVVNTSLNTLSVPVSQFGTYGFAALKPRLNPISRQLTATDAGNNTLGLQGLADGSELDQVSAVARDGWLYLYFGGNLNPLEAAGLSIFFDTVPGGQNRLLTNNSTIELNRMGDDGSGNGLTFDAGFAPDYWLGLNTEQIGSSVRLWAKYATLPTPGGGSATYLGETEAPSAGVLSRGTNPYKIMARLDNRNLGGVPGGCLSTLADTVRTGMEVAIPYQALGVPSACIRVSAFVTRYGSQLISNQVLGPLPPGTCNLNLPRSVNFSSYAGNQYVQVCSLSVVSVPPPSTTPATPRLMVRPNPSHGSVTLELSARAAGDWSVEVFDLAGRRVQRFPSTAFVNGHVIWSGETLAGRTAPAGIYMARLRGKDIEQTVRFLRLP